MNENNIIELIEKVRGIEAGNAIIRIKEYYKVSNLQELTAEQRNLVIKKFELELKIKNAGAKKCHTCGNEVYPKGMFYICNKCHKILN